jgi:hypothetical protein
MILKLKITSLTTQGYLIVKAYSLIGEGPSVPFGRAK